MANQAINPVLRLYEDVYNDEGYASVNHMSKGLLYESEMLSPIVTHLYYRSEQYGRQNFPLSFLTEGMNRIRSINGFEYKIGVIGRPKKSAPVAENLYSAGDKPGLGGMEFVIPFTERRFAKNDTLIARDREVQVHVKRNPEKRGSYWWYTVTLITDSRGNFCPLNLLEPGAKWGRGVNKVGIEDSVGTEHRSYSPSMMRNQLSLVRDTYKIKGNVENKIMVMEIPTDEGVKKYWCEWELYLRQLEWKEKCESDLWYSRYNFTTEGDIITRDEDSGEVVPSGAGVLQQITNEDTYTFLTNDKITQIVRDAFFNASDGTQRNIEVFTGTGGQEEADRAMKEGLSGFTLAESQIAQTEQKWDAIYGFYFKTFRHIDGHTVTFRYLPMLDNGIVAETSEKHPVTNLPLESYSMYFLDMSNYDGEYNIQYVQEKGREDINFVVAGAKTPKGYDPTVYRATSRDGSSIEWMKSQGIQIRRPTNCFKVFNVLS